MFRVSMSLCKWHDTIEKNSVVIIYEGVENCSYLVAEPGKVYSNRFGHFHHDDIIGTGWGRKWEARSGSGGRKRGAQRMGYVYVLHPTPELWTLALAHRTQILYTPDISMVLMQLGIKPGSVVIETGTGSGSLTCAFARSVLPTGHVHTYEFHGERSQKAREDFERNGLTPYVTVTQRNTMESGFPDAVLALPHPPATSTASAILAAPRLSHAPAGAGWQCVPNVLSAQVCHVTCCRRGWGGVRCGVGCRCSTAATATAATATATDGWSGGCGFSGRAWAMGRDPVRGALPQTRCRAAGTLSDAAASLSDSAPAVPATWGGLRASRY